MRRRLIKHPPWQAGIVLVSRFIVGAKKFNHGLIEYGKVGLPFDEIENFDASSTGFNSYVVVFVS